MELAAWSERESIDPETGAVGILRKEWRVGLVVGVAMHDKIHAAFKRAGEWVIEERYIRRGADEGWRLFDTNDELDCLLECIDDGAVALHPRLLELRGQWAEAEAKRQADATAKRLAEDAENAARLKRSRAAGAMRKFRENPRNAELVAKWDEHVQFVKSDVERQAQLAADAEFYRSGMAVYDAETQPEIKKAMRAHLAAWGRIQHL